MDFGYLHFLPFFLVIVLYGYGLLFLFFFISWTGFTNVLFYQMMVVVVKRGEGLACVVSLISIGFVILPYFLFYLLPHLLRLTIFLSVFDFLPKAMLLWGCHFWSCLLLVSFPMNHQVSTCVKYLSLSIGFCLFGCNFVCASSKPSVPLCFFVESLKLPSLVVYIHKPEVISSGNSDGTSHLKVMVFIFLSPSSAANMDNVWFYCFPVHCMFWRGKFWGIFKIRPLSSFCIRISIL